MTAQGKPDMCPMCGSDERGKCNLLPTPAGYEDLCCDDWHSSPVPAARNVSAPNPRQVVTDAIREQEPKPTQLLALLSSQLSYGKIQDILSELLELGTVELGSDRRLRMVLRERPVPAAAPQPQMMRLPYNADYPDYKETHPKDPWCAKAGCVPASAPQAESVPSGKDAYNLPKSAWMAASNLQASLRDRGGVDDNAVIACSLHDYAVSQNAALAAERDQALKYKRALENHLCKYDLADWLGCPGSHGDPSEYCDCCEGDKEHQHQAFVRAEAAERSNSLLRERVTAAEGERDEYKSRTEQLQVQLAGCSVAALGGSKGDQWAVHGDYGYSASYQDVLNLREKVEVANRRINSAEWLLRALAHIGYCNCKQCDLIDAYFEKENQ